MILSPENISNKSIIIVDLMLLFCIEIVNKKVITPQLLANFRIQSISSIFRNGKILPEELIIDNRSDIVPETVCDCDLISSSLIGEIDYQLILGGINLGNIFIFRPFYFFYFGNIRDVRFG